MTLKNVIFDGNPPPPKLVMEPYLRSTYARWSFASNRTASAKPNFNYTDYKTEIIGNFRFTFPLWLLSTLARALHDSNS